MSTSAKDVWLEAGRFRSSPNDAPREKNERLVPQGYLRISEAYDRHLAGMWGGLEQPVPVQAFKAKFKSSARFAGRENYAAQRLTAAALDGKFSIYVVADPKLAPSIDHPRAAPPPTKDPAIVPISILRRLMTWRDKFPDRAIRPTIKTTGGDSKLFFFCVAGKWAFCRPGARIYALVSDGKIERQMALATIEI